MSSHEETKLKAEDWQRGNSVVVESRLLLANQLSSITGTLTGVGRRRQSNVRKETNSVTAKTSANTAPPIRNNMDRSPTKNGLSHGGNRPLGLERASTTNHTANPFDMHTSMSNLDLLMHAGISFDSPERHDSGNIPAVKKEENSAKFLTELLERAISSGPAKSAPLEDVDDKQLMAEQEHNKGLSTAASSLSEESEPKTVVAKTEIDAETAKNADPGEEAITWEENDFTKPTRCNHATCPGCKTDGIWDELESDYDDLKAMMQQLDCHTLSAAMPPSSSSELDPKQLMAELEQNVRSSFTPPPELEEKEPKKMATKIDVHALSPGRLSAASPAGANDPKEMLMRLNQSFRKALASATIPRPLEDDPKQFLANLERDVRSPPPPETEYHPAFSGHPCEPVVRIPQPTPRVRLPPPATEPILPAESPVSMPPTTGISVSNDKKDDHDELEALRAKLDALCSSDDGSVVSPVPNTSSEAELDIPPKVEEITGDVGTSPIDQEHVLPAVIMPKCEPTKIDKALLIAIQFEQAGLGWKKVNSVTKYLFNKENHAHNSQQDENAYTQAYIQRCENDLNRRIDETRKNLNMHREHEHKTDKEYRIVVTNIAADAGEEELEEVFGEYDVRNITMLKARHPTNSTRAAYVDFYDREEASMASRLIERVFGMRLYIRPASAVF